MGERADDLMQRGHTPDAEDDFDETTATAREDIEFTRAEMSSTIDAIQDRLDPEVLSEQAKDTAHDVTDYAIREAKEAAREITDHAIAQARTAVDDVTGQAKAALREATIGKVETMARTATDTAGGWRQSLMQTIKANPMPTALVGLGVGWMLLNRPSRDSDLTQTASRYGYGTPYGRAGYGENVYGPRSSSEPNGGSFGAAVGNVRDSATHVTDQAQQTASQAVQQVQGAAGGMMEQVQDASGQVVERAQEQAARAQGVLQRQLQENPLVVGAVAVAIGGVLAATAPRTEREDQMLGSARDRLVGSARELTEDTMSKVGRVVEEVQTTATDEAKKQSLIPESGA
ncbi:MAG: DUF3618 domain-containing protein [Chloroflexi bacterium]|nr:DUF3618 domain-containing protein [Chloroflexota bacterium]